MVGQVMVVGSAGGGKRFWQSEELKNKISYDLLLTKKTDKTIKRIIHSVLREAGARYSSVDVNKCAKTKALLHNYKFLKQFKNGFRGV